MTIVYIGSKLSKYGKTPMFIEFLAPKLNKYFEVISVSDKKNIFLRFIDINLTLLKRIKKTDLVLIDTYSGLSFYYALSISLLCNLTSIKYIPILRGGNLPWRLEKYNKISSYIFNNAAINIAPSGYLKDIFENFLYRCILIPNSIDVNKYEYKKRNSFEFKLLWVRAFNILYNPVLAVTILDNLIKKGYDATLCMVGPEKDHSLSLVKQKITDLNLKDKVTITGKLSKEEWINLSDDYDIFINTTNFDNHPVSVIEAMAKGLAIVSTNVGGIPYLIQNGVNGITVNPNNENEFVSALEFIHNNPTEAVRYCNAARKDIEKMDWKVIENQWLEIIDKIYND